ncbi:neurite outgrowth regulated kinase precursor [Elysia marginata]|uniref:Neurite outgrowth regulated kinase n=1 Tax=Elysia marginata TaxID=1093978 RepID=A0AAV4EZP3_9GAST|nr:neurite outgrowth regulated kinase precursor [Elysia marginata]
MTDYLKTNQFLNGQADDTRCWETNTGLKVERQCQECWNLCEKLTSSSILIRAGCGRKMECKPGCQTACDFIMKKPKGPPLESRWGFSKKVQVLPSPNELLIEWFPPEREDLLTSSSGTSGSVTWPGSGSSAGPIVYVLATRNANKDRNGWRVVAQLASTKIRIELQALPFVPEFSLMAVSESGVIAYTTFKTETLVRGSFDDPSGPEFRQLRQSPDATWYLDPYDSQSAYSDEDSTNSGSINASLSLFTVAMSSEDGLGEVLHTGRQHAVLKFRGPSWLAANVQHFYSVRWLFMDCHGVYDGVPRCNRPRDDHGATVNALVDEEASYTIKDLNFNSIYQLIVYLKEDIRVYAKLVLKTSRCQSPDAIKLYHCLDDVPKENRSKVPVKLANSDDYEPEILRLSVNISSMSLRPGTDVVLVNVTWVPVLNQSAVTYNVTTYTEKEGTHVALLTTPHPYIVLTLRQNTIYRVQVAADVASPSDASLDTVHIFETLEFNTSEVNLEMYRTPQPFRSGSNQEIEEVNGIIIGVICFVVVVVLVLLTVFLYKKRNSFKGIIDTKATVAKSNSYKSNVGGKSDYSNQLVAFSDEWEIDPALLKFSTQLGQGAFGKVVTGYYQDQRVAIKLVREGAPVSYKEDLVAEINLMKRIGNHPNIVCLIGACTLNEPIALVMEYVPYGNLHNFLKKCRLEGDLRKRSDGPSEITYTMIQDSGGLECGVVTPADMLSFARQVAMAMEYMSEKKYVHRDLAARNVLIDHGKVVKVCDFGLSRDVFHDNHYKKLTNGKLPLKWMAIESLRDRIFTTQSDVWSFGIVLWEIVTMGASPYPSVALADLYYVLSSGYRMDKPSNCSQQLYDIMRSCWVEEPLERPDFTQLRLMLEDLLTEDRDYLVLEDIDVPISHSDNSSSPFPGGAPSSDQPPTSVPQNTDPSQISSLLPSPPPSLSPLSPISQQSYATSPKPPSNPTKLLPPPPKAQVKQAHQVSPLSPHQTQQQHRRQHFFAPDDSLSNTSSIIAVVDHRHRAAAGGSPLTPMSPSTGAILTTFSPTQRPSSASGSAGSTAASTSFSFPAYGCPPDIYPAASSVNNYNNSSVISATSNATYDDYNNTRKSLELDGKNSGSIVASAHSASPTSLFQSFPGLGHKPTRSLSSSSSTSSTSSLTPLSLSNCGRHDSPSKPGTVGPNTTKYVKKTAPRRDHMRINVCTHQNSTDRLFRPSESDSSPSSC